MHKLIILLAAALLVAPDAASGQGPALGDLIDGLERKLRGIRDLSADFVQIHEDPLNRTYREEGHLYLRRPRMMRWEYQTPEEKLFVTRGDTVYLYVPADRQVNRERVDDAFDDRIPIMFLLGRSDLQNEFSRIVEETRANPPTAPGARVLRMYPRRESDIADLLLEVDPASFDIRRLRMNYQDGAVAEFHFDRIRTNTGLSDSLFIFEPPAGAEVIDGIGR